MSSQVTVDGECPCCRSAPTTCSSVHVLSHDDRGKHDRLLEAFDALSSAVVDGQMVVERVVPKLATLSFCAKGKPSELATARYREIGVNLGQP